MLWLSVSITWLICIKPPNPKVVRYNASVPIAVWWMVAPSLGLNFQLLFCGFSSRGWYPCRLWRTERWMQNSLCDFRRPGPSSLWCMKTCVSPRLQYVWVVFLTPFFYVVHVVMLCIVKQEQTRKSMPVWNIYCQLLSDLLGSGVIWKCLMWILSARLTTQIFGDPSGV